MSHVIIKMGNYLPFHPFAHLHDKPSSTPPLGHPVPMVTAAGTPPCNDLAIFGLCEGWHPEDGRTELERLSLVNCGSETSTGPDESWLILP